MAIACGNPAPDSAAASAVGPSCDNPTTLRFVPDTGSADEAYLCFGFDAQALATSTIRAVHWQAPSSTSAFQIHHATLYAVPGDYPAGPLVCDGMPPGAVGLHVWTPGGSNLDLPADTGLELPAGTQRFVIESHALWVGSGPVEDGRVTLCQGPSAPAHLAALLGYPSPVPAIRPEHIENSEGICTLGGSLHLWSVWPHMHLLGKEISVDLVRSVGAAQPLIDVDPWNFHAQKTYPLAVDASAGDALHTHCTWQNDTVEYVFPGPLTENEMCGTALIAWPAEAAFCQ
jgi:Copper type II ascorbate-dependent monooxygenase, C-terminal domain